MKKILAFSMAALLSACAQGSIYNQYDQDCNDHFYSAKSCPVKKATPQKRVVKKAENNTNQYKVRLVPQDTDLETLVAAMQRKNRVQSDTIVSNTVKNKVSVPVAVISDTGCNGCQPIVRQVREPVEVIYKKTTYTTVFEPKTTATVTYEKEMISDPKVVSDTPQQIEIAPVTKEIKRVIENNEQSISYTIENTQQSAPSELLIEDIK